MRSVTSGELPRKHIEASHDLPRSKLPNQRLLGVPIRFNDFPIFAAYLEESSQRLSSNGIVITVAFHLQVNDWLSLHVCTSAEVSSIEVCLLKKHTSEIAFLILLHKKNKRKINVLYAFLSCQLLLIVILFYLLNRYESEK